MQCKTVWKSVSVQIAETERATMKAKLVRKNMFEDEERFDVVDIGWRLGVACNHLLYGGLHLQSSNLGRMLACDKTRRGFVGQTGACCWNVSSCA